MPVHNYRVDPFTGADNSKRIVGEAHVVPTNSPFHVWLDEVPRQDAPSSITVSLAAPVVSHVLASSEWGDTYVSEAAPNQAYGSGGTLVVGTNGAGGTQRNRALVRFDLSGLPSGVRRAFVRLYLESANPSYTDTRIVGAHEATATWNEGTVAWTTAPAHATVAAGTATISGNGWYDLDITDLYNAWQAGTRPNYGVVIKHGNEAGQDSALVFTSSDGPNAYRPSLYLVPSGALFEEIEAAVSPSTMQVGVNHERAVLRFPQGSAGSRVLVDYYGTGSPINEDDVGQIDRLLGRGEDGDLVVTSGTVVLNGQKRYSSVYVAPGATITTDGPSPLCIGVTGDCRIHGNINLDGKGYAGGIGGNPYFAGYRGRGASGGDGGFGSAAPAPWDGVAHGILGLSVVQALVAFTQMEQNAPDPIWYAYTMGLRQIPGLTGPTPGDILAVNLEQYLLPTISSKQKAALSTWCNNTPGATIADLVTWLEANVRANAATGTSGGGGGGGSAAGGTSGTAGIGQGAGHGGRGGDRSWFVPSSPSDFFPPEPGGGGGGGGGYTDNPGGAGGAGGGALLLQVEGDLYVDTNATLTANGSPGSSPGGGGGGGGAIRIRASRRDIRCTPAVNGGAGATNGGSGAIGWCTAEDM